MIHFEITILLSSLELSGAMNGVHVALQCPRLGEGLLADRARVGMHFKMLTDVNHNCRTLLAREATVADTTSVNLVDLLTALLALKPLAIGALWQRVQATVHVRLELLLRNRFSLVLFL